MRCNIPLFGAVGDHKGGLSLSKVVNVLQRELILECNYPCNGVTSRRSTIDLS
jgi:hypothetical protein